MAPNLSKRRIIKPGNVVNLNRSRQIITRLQSMRIAETFPLLSLPAELRLCIYEFCFTFAGLDNWFDKFWRMLKASDKPRDVVPPRVFKGTPEVLLVCKQVYVEAYSVLKKQGISFHHGLLDLAGLDNLMNPAIITNISHLRIDAAGHQVLPPKETELVGPSWRGHLDLIVELAHLLAKGHKLQSFTLDFADKSMHEHVNVCWDKPMRCDFRDQLTEALEHLKKVRSVPHVTLLGIPNGLIEPLKKRMQSHPTSFLDLPGELRNEIYALAADWSDISPAIARTMAAWDPSNKHKPDASPPYPTRTNPTVFLLNKQITHEATSILHARPLHLAFPSLGTDTPATQTETLNALKFIHPATLAKVRHLRISIPSWEWACSLDRFLPALAHVHGLQSLHFAFHDYLKATFLTHEGKPYPDRTLHLSLLGLSDVRGVGRVTFEGDLPAVYTEGLKGIMESRKVKGEVLPALKGVTGDGVVKEID